MKFLHFSSHILATRFQICSMLFMFITVSMSIIIIINLFLTVDVNRPWHVVFQQSTTNAPHCTVMNTQSPVHICTTVVHYDFNLKYFFIIEASSVYVFQKIHVSINLCGIEFSRD